MSWWARQRLRTKIFVPFALLIAAVLLAALWLTQYFIAQQAERGIRAQLVVTGQVFKGLLAEHAQQLQGNMRLLASDFALKRAIATYDPATLASVAQNYQDRVAVDVLWVTDDQGVVLADSHGTERPAITLADRAPLADALSNGTAAHAVTAVEGKLLQLVAVPVLAPDPIGFVLAGNAIDDATARRLEADTGSSVSFFTAQQLFASSWKRGERSELFPADQPIESLRRAAAGRAFQIEVAGKRFLSLLVNIDAAVGAPLSALIQQSYEEALEPLSLLRQRIVLIGGAAMVAALLVGVALAAGIAAPLQSIVAAMRSVLQGDLQQIRSVKRQDEIGFLAKSFNEMVAGLAEREFIKETFGRFVSRAVADVVLKGGIGLAGDRRTVTVLFQDIRGFTTLAEKTDPHHLVDLLNRWLTRVVHCIEDEGGVIRQFTGDGVIAMFGAPIAHDNDPERAVCAALRIVEELASWNEERRAAGEQPLRIGIGIHTGEVVAARIGPPARMEYAVVGDTVNLASRIEGLTKEVGCAILISAETAALLPPRFRLGRRSTRVVRGREKPVEVIEVL